jgi:Mce-associated membrane protein
MNRKVVAAIVVGVVLVTGGVVAVVASGEDKVAGRPTAQSSPDTGPTAERDAALGGGSEVARVLNTLDYTSAEEDYNRWEAVSTGDMLTELRSSRDQFIQSIAQAQTKTVATVLSAALAEFDAKNGTARLLAAVNIVVTKDGQQSPKRTRITVSLKKTPDGWKASSVATV